MGEETGGMLIDTLRQAAGSPVFLFFLIMSATLILEDAAATGAALLAGEGVVAPGLALAALYAGIVVGDLSLYGLGHLASHRPWLRERIGAERLEKGQAWLSGRLIFTLFGARCVPGMRLPTYLASGFLGVSFTKFAAIAIVAAAAWTTVFFSLVYTFGQAAAQVLGGWSWIVGLGLLLAALVVPNLIARRLGRRPGSGPRP
ncbi:MAG: DedA family protein [Alphaproteobacteria bacterium]